jgi:hypothetical protein
MVLDLFERARKDGEDTMQAVREHDELHQWDGKSCQWILNLQGKLEKERGLKLVAQEKVTALEAKARQDVAVVERLCKERDDSR